MNFYQILIPAYNASNTVAALLNQISLLKEPPGKIIVVNDGSTDDTKIIAEKSGAKVISLPENKGKGAALITGFDYFLNNEKDKYLVCMDADLQHSVSSIPEFLKIAKSNNSALIIGNRDKSFKSMPWHRIISNFLTSGIISFLAKQKIDDSQCGFRMIRRDILRKIIFEESGFQLESEMIVKVANLKEKIDSVQIPTIYNSEVSNINNWKDTSRFILFSLKEFKRYIVNRKSE